jgi:arylsulfatase A-like enzyme/tetratricopeptide (TPR) repeat protein
VKRLLSLVFVLCALSACAQKPPNVVLITLDTTRADHLGCYGYPNDTTPVIDELAKNATIFSNAFSTNPITLPAHTSIMTGTTPLHHGVRDNSTYVVPDEVETLAEVLSANGWSTAAFVASFVLDSRFNLDQGFESYDDDIESDWSYDELAKRERNAFGFSERKASLVATSAVEWLRQAPSDPFFTWLHFFDPHQPIDPPEPHRSIHSYGYDAEIAFVDEQIGRFLSTLEQTGREDRTLIVIVGDHGEGLLDHDEPTHSLLIFDSTMQVPLIIREPGQQHGLVVDGIASIVDVMPTILELVGIDAPPDVQGRSLVPLINGEPAEADRAVYMESLVARLQSGWGELRGLRTASEKLIHGPAPRLYRVDEDPGEVYDLAATRPEDVDRLTTRLQAFIDASAREGAGTPGLPDEEARRMLESLGYVVSPVRVTRGLSNDLDEVSGMADPHAKRHLFDLHSVALESIRTGSYFDGIRQLEAVIASDPANAGAITDLASAYLIYGLQPAKARELFERSLALNEHQEQAHYFMARLCESQGDLNGARAHAEAILAFEPQSYGALYELGRIFHSRGEVELASEYFLRAVDVDPSNLSAIMALATLHARRHENDQADRYFEMAIAIDPANPEVLYNLGIWFMQLGQSDEALAALRRAVLANPNDRDAHYVIGKLLFERGDLDEAQAALQTARAPSVGGDRLAKIDELLARIAERRD